MQFGRGQVPRGQGQAPHHNDGGNGQRQGKRRATTRIPTATMAPPLLNVKQQGRWTAILQRIRVTLASSHAPMFSFCGWRMATLTPRAIVSHIFTRWQDASTSGLGTQCADTSIAHGLGGWPYPC